MTRSHRTTTIVSVCLSAACLGITLYAFGSLEAFSQYLAGMRVVPQSRLIDLGQCVIGETYDLVIPIANHSASPAELIGRESDCRCVSGPEQGVIILPGATQDIIFQVHFNQPSPPGSPTIRNVMLRFMTDRLDTVDIQIRGDVVSPGVPELAGDDEGDFS